MKSTNRIFFFLLILFAFSLIHIAAAATPDLSLQKEIRHAMHRGLVYLHQSQEENGSWQHHPAITSLVLSAFLRSHPSITPEDSLVSAGFAFLQSCVHENGGIYVDDMQTYSTAIALMAFRDARYQPYEQIIRTGQNFIIEMQRGQDDGLTPDSLNYGGVSYGKPDKPCNLSNLHWALEALASDAPHSDSTRPSTDDQEFSVRKQLFWDRALVFLQRCQNLQSHNDQSYSTDDGGFMYSPGTSKAGDTRSYGSMTYAGLKSYLHAQVSRDDPRVQAAYRWLQSHYRLDENPGMGLQGLYYYYHTMAKTLNTLGDEGIQDAEGIVHPWRNQLADQLLQIQQSDGSWVNSNGRWWENNPILVTAYSLLALEEILGDRPTRSYLLHP
ncbi:terpene cyclase/mutase family protein [candidate division KSB1 bacterium]|nr:terpene cyclase/mutase family protein [candidate division KSB1 bacterium]